MYHVLGDDLVKSLPVAAPGFNRLDIKHFMAADSPWLAHKKILGQIICEKMKAVVLGLRQSLGPDHRKWRWGDLHQIEFWHRLHKQPQWSHLHLGPDAIGGSPFTLAMAVHMGRGPGNSAAGDVPCRVFHGPAYRLVVDLADYRHARFVIAGGNSGRSDSAFVTNQYESWLNGDYYTVFLDRKEITEFAVWQISR
jgi:penicillin amidase